MADERTGKLFREHRQTFIWHGARLEIVAAEIERSQWALSIVNDIGISSNWCEFFESKDQAIEVALDAIREEGIESFYDSEGFEYLHDDEHDV